MIYVPEAYKPDNESFYALNYNHLATKNFGMNFSTTLHSIPIERGFKIASLNIVTDQILFLQY